MKRFLCIFLLAALLLTGCAGAGEVQLTKYSATFLTLFDTVTTIVGYAENEETFKETTQAIHDELLVYHQLFDVYNDYEGVVNLKTINDTAATAPVQVDQKIMDLLTDCKAYYELTNGRVNVAMGSVLYLWHEARDYGYNDPVNAYLPDQTKLESAAEHMDLENLVLDSENSTVYFADPQLRLDVGAIAKGWALQRVCENAPSGLLISVGGNVCATGPRSSDGTDWVVGVTDPAGGESYLHTLYLNKGSVVTSGDYQRTYMVDGKLYHHIIDPDTLYPSSYWSSVTIVCADSGLADALSTALFLLPLEEGQALVSKCGAEALWVDPAGNLYYSPGFEALIRT